MLTKETVGAEPITERPSGPLSGRETPSFQISNEQLLLSVSNSYSAESLGRLRAALGSSEVLDMLVMLEVMVRESQFGHHSKNNRHERVMTHLCTCAYLL